MTRFAKPNPVLTAAKTCLLAPQLFRHRTRYLFLLSHMRSYSSLLSHLLGSHPEIAGHNERLRRYRGATDLLRARLDEARSTGRTSYTYLLDKVLHDSYCVSPRILARPDVRVMIFVREPRATFKSIVHMGRDLLHEKEYCDLGRALDYYTRRLRSLVETSQIVHTRALFFDADRIVNDTEHLLDAISDWLGLRTPLTGEYTVFSDTGERYRGDPSGNSKEGRVLARAPDPHRDIDIPTEILARAEEAYTQCRRQLTEHCHPVFG